MKAIITADLLFGDSGKGTVVDYLSSKFMSTLVIRYNGGSQCAHNVYADDHFCFHQLSSGSFNNADTLLLDTVIINPILLQSELVNFKHSFGTKYKFNVYIHDNALVTTPYHVTANRVEELKLKHGSCGLGIWKTIEFAQKDPLNAIRIKDLYGSFELLCNKLSSIRAAYKSTVDESIDSSYQQDYMCDELLRHIARKMQCICTDPNIIKCNDDTITKLIKKQTTIIFEGAQGVLLDKDRGVLPHVSATDTSTYLAEEFLQRINYKGYIHKMGIIRSYVTRHGAGPLPSEIKGLKIPGENNEYNEWQQDFRVGTFDKSLIKKALEICPIDSIFITCLDNDPFKRDDHYLHYAKQLAEMIEIPLSGISYGKKRIYKEFISLMPHLISKPHYSTANNL